MGIENLTVQQIKKMSIEVGELLVKLKEKNVFDFDESIPILLIDRSSSKMQFKSTDILRVKRFVSLIRKYIYSLQYLTKNIQYENKVKDVERTDRIMGSINYRKTMNLQQRGNKNIVVCSEIHKSFHTPENIFLTLILLAIVSYCDKYIKLEGLVESNRFNPTISELRIIQAYVSNLLLSKNIRQIISYTTESFNRLDDLLYLIYVRLKNQKIPHYYLQVIKLFYKWKYFISVSYNDKEIAKDVLYYHFMNLENQNDLYECWVFSKLLYEIAITNNIGLRQIRSAKGLVTFTSLDNSFKITYQARYLTKWKDQEENIEDVPDIIIERADGNSFIIDAKNIYYSSKNSRPNLHQMRNYITTTQSTSGIFIHSNAEEKTLWKEIESAEKNQKIIWTALVPNTLNENLNQIITHLIG